MLVTLSRKTAAVIPTGSVSTSTAPTFSNNLFEEISYWLIRDYFLRLLLFYMTGNAVLASLWFLSLGLGSWCWPFNVSMCSAPFPCWTPIDCSWGENLTFLFASRVIYLALQPTIHPWPKRHSLHLTDKCQVVFQSGGGWVSKRQ